MSSPSFRLPSRLAVPATALALAALAGCRDATSSRDSASREALQRDLELAQASSVALAQHDLPPTRFVSAIEAGERPTAGPSAAARPARKSPNKAPRRSASHAAPAVTTVAAEHAPQSTAGTEVVSAPTSTGSAVASTESASAPAEPTASGPSDAGVVGSTPNDGPSAEGRHGRGIGGILGGVIGVVIRGGGIGDDDHCERDHPGTARMPGMPGGIGGIGGIGGVYGGLPRPGGRIGGGRMGPRF